MTSLQAARRVALHTVDPTTSSLWADLIATQPSSVFHTPRWMSVIQESYDLPVHAHVLLEGDRPTAGAPWCQVDDLAGRRRVTLAFSDYCDVLADDPSDAHTLAHVILSDGQPWLLRTMARSVPRIDLAPTASSHFKWHGIDLLPDPEALWSGMTSMARRGVQKARRSDLEIREAESKTELREWFLLHLRLRKYKHHLLAQPYRFFEAIWDAFIATGQGFLLLAKHQGRVIGGTVYLLWRDTCYYKFNASDPAYLALRPNNVLMWEGMVRARELGCQALDLGRTSAHQDGLLNFKRGGGAREEDLAALTYDPAGAPPVQRELAQQTFKELTRLLVQETVPDEVSEEAGSLLYRFFP
jgi:CelD/BcsL family acetyltransferase involved in cellulose biosynthesis